MLGDSFTEARQIPIEDTYWDRLGKALDDCATIAGQDVEVLNFGIGGYSTTQSLLAYDLDARRFKPDLV
ncbi:MAG: SGNH/GDSL hydrolase family protein, partial [Geminicoccaceae bacterium]